MHWSKFQMAIVAGLLALAPGFVWGITPINSARELQPDQIGEFVTLSGQTFDFRAPRSSREPYSFWLRDAAGATVRVCAWPEIMQSISRWQDLRTTGTAVSMTAEVADYEGVLELHIQDGEEVRIAGPAAVRTGAAVTSGSAAATGTTSGSRRVISP